MPLCLAVFKSTVLSIWGSKVLGSVLSEAAEILKYRRWPLRSTSVELTEVFWVWAMSREQILGGFSDLGLYWTMPLAAWLFQAVSSHKRFTGYVPQERTYVEWRDNMWPVWRGVLFNLRKEIPICYTMCAPTNRLSDRDQVSKLIHVWFHVCGMSG